MAYRFLDGITKLSEQNLSALGGTLEDVAPYVPQENINPMLLMGRTVGLPMLASSSASRYFTPGLTKLLGGTVGKAVGNGLWAPIQAGFDLGEMYGVPGIMEGRFSRELRGAYNYGANMGRQMPFLAYFLQNRLARQNGATPASAAHGIGTSPAGAAGSAITSASRRNIPTGRINTNMPPRHPVTDVGGSRLVGSPSANDYSESRPSSMSTGGNASRSISGRLAGRVSRPSTMIARSILRQQGRTA